MEVIFEGEKYILDLSGLDSLETFEIEDALKIDYSNIIGELLTFPVILNRIGLFVAEQEELVSLINLDAEILFSKISEEKRMQMTDNSKDDKGKVKINKPTAPEVENALKSDRRYKDQKQYCIQQEKYLKRLQTIYASAKSKDRKLDTLYMKVTPREHEEELVEGVFNKISIKKAKKLIPDPIGYKGK